jgi:hypothetical protein
MTTTIIRINSIGDLRLAKLTSRQKLTWVDVLARLDSDERAPDQESSKRDSESAITVVIFAHADAWSQISAEN